MSRQRFTIDDLIAKLRTAAGDGDGDGGAAGTSAQILDVRFDELGYDSIALLETAAHIEREFRISLPDSTVAEATTPRAFLAVVNERLAVLVAD